MSLFASISSMKSFIGGAANVSIEMDSIGPVIDLAAQKHIVPWIGPAQWADLVDNLNSPSAAQTALLPYVQRPLAMLAFYEYAHIGGVQFSEAGIFRVETDEMKSAYKYQENQYKTWMLENGHEALELMLRFLHDNKSDYPLWAASTAFSRHLSLTINYAADFRNLYSHYLSRYTFELIRPAIEDVETFAILPMLGEEQFDRIKAGIPAGDLTADETTLLSLIQRAVADFAVKEAAERLWVRIEGKNVVQVEGLEPQTYDKYSSPIAGALGIKLRHQELTANRHISRLRKYLDDNSDKFPLYEAYLEALAAAEAEAAEEAECVPSDWPRHPYYAACCTNYPDCVCNGSNSTKKGMVNL